VSPRVDTVVFDVGGVLCASPPAAFAAVDHEHGLPAQTIETIFRTGPLWAEVEQGRMALGAFFGRCIDVVEAEHGVTITAERLEAMLRACTTEAVREEMVALVHEVKAAGHRTAILSNIFAECRPWLHSFCGEGAVDVVCDSSEIGLRKPDPAIYAHLLDRLGVPGDAVVFIDDFPENLGPAQALGIRTVLYVTPGQVRAALTGLGVALTPAS
jgi:epoxide hydrolase-like predicted phosphatase